MNSQSLPVSRPSARLGDILRVLAVALLGAMLATLRRLLGRQRRPAWGFGLEVLTASYRGTWSVMPKIGIVGWRSVGEAMSPLRMDGLTPKFVRCRSGKAELNGVWLEPPEMNDAVLLYFHGGGFVFGSLRTHGSLIGALARASRARTFAVEYRLAPEYPLPNALEDALAAYRYLLAEGVSPQKIVLAGDSAGGTLVLNTLLALRDAAQPLPAAGVALSPWVDLGCSGKSFQSNAAFDFVGKEHCLLAAGSYLAGADPKRPDISPLFADLSALPPLLIHAGEAETLVDQIRDFSTRATAAGVNARLEVYGDMVHVWHLMRSGTPKAQQAIDEIGAFVREQAK